MVPKARKEAPAPPKVEAKKSVLKGVHGHKKRTLTSPTFPRPEMLWLRRQPKCPRESAQEKEA